MKYIITVFILGFSFQSLYAKTQTNFHVTTWNVRHLMSLDIFPEWNKYCKKYNYDEAKVPKDKPKNYTYCNAHNGLSFPKREPESLPLTDIFKYMQKATSLKKVADELKSDIYLFQEVSDKAAVELIVNPLKYKIFTDDDPIPLNLAFAVKNDLAKEAELLKINKIAVKDKEGRKVRPALELKIKLNGQELSILNVHLKSGCKNYVIDDPDTSYIKNDPNKTEEDKKSHIESVNNGCYTLRKQIPVLESWVEEKTNNDELYMISGDFNREILYDLGQDARIDGTDPKSTITGNTKISSMLKEISDDEPKGSILKWIKGEVVFKGTKCHKSLDHFMFGKKLYDLLNKNWSSKSSFIIDYTDENYGLDKAKPSDHCPVTYRMRIKPK